MFCLPQIYAKGSWGHLWYSPHRLRGNIAKRTAMDLGSNYELILMNEILVATVQIIWFHITIGINQV